MGNQNTRYRLSKTEMKILVFNKMKREGKSYEEARNEVARDLEQLNKTKELSKKKEKEVSRQGNNKKFSEEFGKLVNGH